MTLFMSELLYITNSFKNIGSFTNEMSLLHVAQRHVTVNFFYSSTFETTFVGGATASGVQNTGYSILTPYLLNRTIVFVE